MARVPLIQEQDHPELAEVIEKYRSGRRGKLINMYRMLLNAPAPCEGAATTKKRERNGPAFRQRHRQRSAVRRRTTAVSVSLAAVGSGEL